MRETHKPPQVSYHLHCTSTQRISSQRSKRIFGVGLLTESSQAELQQRRTLQPLVSGAAFEGVDDVIVGSTQETIAGRRASSALTNNMPSMLMHAEYKHGRAMRDQQVRDEALTIASTGRQAIGMALAWTWYLPAKRPKVALPLTYFPCGVESHMCMGETFARREVVAVPVAVRPSFHFEWGKHSSVVPKRRVIPCQRHGVRVLPQRLLSSPQTDETPVLEPSFASRPGEDSGARPSRGQNHNNSCLRALYLARQT